MAVPSGEVRAMHPNGFLSERRYTRGEMAASVRVGVAYWDHGRAGGPIFWAGGPYHPEQAAQMAADWALVAEAMKREWDRPDAEASQS